MQKCLNQAGVTTDVIWIYGDEHGEEQGSVVEAYFGRVMIRYFRSCTNVKISFGAAFAHDGALRTAQRHVGCNHIGFAID